MTISLTIIKQRLRNKWKDLYALKNDSEYKNTHEKCTFICRKHGDFETTVHSLLSGHGCKKCRSDKIRYINRLTNDEVLNKCNEVWGNDNYDFSTISYINARTKITPTCKIHGAFSIRYSDFINGHGCALCANKESVLERKLHIKLNECNDIIFEQEKRFEWLGLQSLDFYLPDYNIAIECQGSQHFVPKPFSNRGEEYAKEQLKLNLERDLRKKNLCKFNKINLIYFLDKKYNSYMSSDDKYFNNVDDLINYIRNFK